MTFPDLHNDDILRLSTQVGDTKVKKDMFLMKSWKAPGPYKIPAGFYQMSYIIVGESVCNFVKKTWRNSHELGGNN